MSIEMTTERPHYFFGYGSLVNRATHDYPDARPATLQGWRRAWVGTPGYRTVLLTGVRAPGHSIDGLIAAVPGGDWQALDMREKGYARLPTGDNVRHDLADPVDIAVYAVDPQVFSIGDGRCILMSYLDVVVQGFLRVFGEDGVQDFFDTTDNWSTPILDDRAAPLYPRHQKLTTAEAALVDRHLDRIGAEFRQDFQDSFPDRY
ncbi:gamma-glutamylcyclotransferase family protein [Sulfitobacter sp. D35]|uniref:gamma-glutamylcyclotransferase family protein n=1 Tax=Sulfitobacter sp. D35 TaxID=3083252 RepID=UPI00296F3ABE|nr:gamma-glutamylcyclotransferase family protein [Sulfitobacter sp. D35]MDW4498411.1 gamma-glutamylcyclotransferase family protein [Sulfitobacter sp. D35]